MSNGQAASQEPKELYSLLIPLKNERLLVPRMCVAEVIAFADAARDRRDDHPDWFLGHYRVERPTTSGRVVR